MVSWHIFLSLALIHGAEAAEISDEQSLVQRSASIQALAVEPNIFSSPQQLFDVSQLLPAGFNSLRAGLPARLQQAMGLFENLEAEHAAKLATGVLLSFRNDTYVAKVNATIVKLGSILKKFVEDVEMSDFHFRNDLEQIPVENVNRTFTMIVLERNSQELVNITANATSKLVMAIKDIFDSQPTEFMQNELAGVITALKDMTREEISMSVQSFLEPRVQQIFSDKEHICKEYPAVDSSFGIVAINTYQKAAKCEADKAKFQDAVSYIDAIAPDVTTKFMKTYNLSMDTMKKHAQLMDIGLLYEKMGIEDVLEKHFKCVKVPLA